MDMDNIDNFVYYGKTRVVVHNISAVCLASIKTIPSVYLSIRCNRFGGNFVLEIRVNFLTLNKVSDVSSSNGFTLNYC